MSGIHKLYRRDNQPFAQIPNDAIRNPEITANGFRLLAYLMSHQDGYDLTYSQIERETALGRFAINGSIKNLEDLGWLETSATKLPNGQFGPKAWVVKNPSLSTTVGNSTAVDSTVEQPTDYKKTTTREDKDREQVHRQDELDDAFDVFWQLYPRKQYKAQVQKTFTKVVTRRTHPVSADVLIDGARRLAADPNLPSKEFIPNGERWLNQGGWENDPYPVREKSKDDLEAARAAEARRRRDLDVAETAQRRTEAKAAEEQLRLNPPKLCEHGRVAVICTVCSLKNVTARN